jgi:hypothetical protein
MIPGHGGMTVLNRVEPAFAKASAGKPWPVLNRVGPAFAKASAGKPWPVLNRVEPWLDNGALV